MTKQEIFDTVVKQMAAQNFLRSLAGGVGCAYRGENGTKCAAGTLITDANYHPSLEHKSAWTPEVRKALEASGVSEEFNGFVSDLQGAHDGAMSPETMKRNFRSVAKRSDVTLPPELVEPE